MKITKSYLAWALFALMAFVSFAFTPSASASANIVWSVDPSSMIRKPVKAGQAYSVTYNGTNIGDVAGFVSKLETYNFGIGDSVASTNLETVSVLPEDKYGTYRLATLKNGILIMPGQTTSVTISGIALSNYDQVWIVMDWVGGYFPGTVPDWGHSPKIGQVVDDIPVQGLGANFSARGKVSPGSPLIDGFTVSDDGVHRVLIRAVGPTLKSLGVGDALADPVVTLYMGSQAIGTNDDWDVSDHFFTQVGAFPLPAGSKDACLLVDLPKGAYTAIVTGKGSSGSVLLEMYQVPVDPNEHIAIPVAPAKG